MTRRRILTVVIGVLVLAWLVPAVFVSFYDPATAPGPLPFEADIPGAKGNPFFPYGYRIGGGSDSWSEDGPHFGTGWHAQRGPLDRRAATYPFGVRYVVEEGKWRLRSIRVLVTSETSYAFPHDDRQWTEVARADASDNAAQCDGIVPADSAAFRVDVFLEGETEPTGFSHNMPAAKTLLGRAYDRIAYLPMFAWLPELR